MRTPEQIVNLRKVLCMTYGPFFLFCQDEIINIFADRLQTAMDRNGEWTWEIKIITADDFGTDWSVIKPEPRTPHCSVYTIKKSCKGLLRKHPQIISILAIAIEDPKLVLQFNS